MRGLLFFVGLLTGLWAIDQIAFEGQYSMWLCEKRQTRPTTFGIGLAIGWRGILPL